VSAVEFNAASIYKEDDRVFFKCKVIPDP